MPSMGARASRLGRGAAGIVVFMLVWEGAVRLLGLPAYILPPPSVILMGGASRWRSLLDASLFTLQPMLLGFALAAIIGVLIALAIAFSRTAQAVAYPLLVFLQIVPKIAVAPLFIIWFGFGLTPKLLLVFLLCFFPILVSATAGLRSVPNDILDLARSTGTTEWLIFRKIRLPHAMPSIFTGLKVAATLATTAAIVAEFVASDRGLGYMLLEFNGNLETGMVFATVILLSIIGVTLFFAVEFVERRVVSWHVSQRNQAGSTTLIGS